MNKVLMIAFCSIYGVPAAMAQNSKMQNHCNQLPMKAGDITYLADTLRYQPANSFVISSDKNEVYSLAQGKVEIVIHFSNTDYSAVGVDYRGDTVIEYTMLSDVSVKQGDMVNKGDVIGKALPNQQTGKNEAAIEIKVPRTATKLHDPQVMSFIKRMDS